ncbi:CDP-glycerol glycerophosphotransferase family protein [Labilibaculum sp. DW002]|uniref:CDP-glycerol glycerophosphotransferase family protein n=1 Tax=Paralabilibaculum antarcticum TaxID=2912572 RepID=A0ABT5VTA3_9BACT|nr:CDP-glycerol glycerophosphotransferase family protein [Labilibaculum sp. DW002]MDE5418642.1 CDP-glycerol glycerophosphotransferase family protein [Labilibaculum sp. DW002]
MKIILRRISIVIYAIIGWCILLPLSSLFPKKKDLIVFIGGRKEGLFQGNIKFLYQHLEKTHKNLYFLTYSRKEYIEIKKHYNKVICYPSIKSIYLLLRCKIAVVDIYEWIKDFRYFLLFRSKIVQLWHGVGFKRIQLDSPSYIEDQKKFFPSLEAILYALYPKYDVLISTSEFYTEQLFKRAFKSKKIIECGYPRNDIFFRETTKNDLIRCDIEAYNKIWQYKKEDYKLILYAPTYRETGGDPISSQAIQLHDLNQYAKNNKLIFVFKFHTYTNLSDNQEFFSNILSFDNELDVYPALKMMDLLITDYSSIYMDYLLLNKPILYYPYDYEKYIEKDRAIQFDYEWITAGEKCYSQKELLDWISHILMDGKDTQQVKRSEICDLAFTYKDGKASERISNEIDKMLMK